PERRLDAADAVAAQQLDTLAVVVEQCEPAARGKKRAHLVLIDLDLRIEDQDTVLRRERGVVEAGHRFDAFRTETLAREREQLARPLPIRVAHLERGVRGARQRERKQRGSSRKDARKSRAAPGSDTHPRGCRGLRRGAWWGANHPVVRSVVLDDASASTPEAPRRDRRTRSASSSRLGRP